MAFDGLFTRAMVKELADCLVGGRVAKISAPYQSNMPELSKLPFFQTNQNKILPMSYHNQILRRQLFLNLAHAKKNEDYF